jgi:hypothetical protein
MAWRMAGGEPDQDQVELAHLAADVAEHESVMAYVRLRPLLAVVAQAARRAESAARLDAALRLAT